MIQFPASTATASLNLIHVFIHVNSNFVCQYARLKLPSCAQTCDRTVFAKDWTLWWSFNLKTVLPCVNQVGWSPSVTSFSILHASFLWNDISFFNQQERIIPDLGVVQPFICTTLSLRSLSDIVTGGCGITYAWWSAVSSAINIVAGIRLPNYYYFFLGGSGSSTLWLPFFNRVYILETSEGKSLLIMQALFSPLYLFSRDVRTARRCFAVFESVMTRVSQSFLSHFLVFGCISFGYLTEFAGI